MSIVQPENGLPERRLITADSFRALKLKLSGGKQRTVPAAPLQTAPVDVPPSAGPEPVVESIEALPDVPLVIALPHIPEPPEAIGEPMVHAASDVAESVAEIEAPPPEPELYEIETTTPSEPETFAWDAVREAAASDSIEPEIATADAAPAEEQADVDPAAGQTYSAETPDVLVPVRSDPGFVERRVLEAAQPEDADAGQRAHALLDIMAIPTSGSLPQERALANDTLLRLIPRMPLKSLRHLADRVCMMEAPSEMLVRRLINDSRIEVSGPLLENAMTVHDSDLIAVATTNNPAKLKLMARRRIISPALSEALIQSNHVDTLLNLVRNQGAAFSIESMWRLTRFAAAHPVLQAPLVTRPDTPSPIAFQLFWRLPSELRRYVLSRFLTDSETITKILTMNMENEGAEQKYADLSLLSKLEDAEPEEAGEIYSKLTHVSEETGARIADDAGGEALTVALKAAGLTRAQFAGLVDKRADAESLKAIFETLSFNKARVLLTYWDWAVRRTGPYARTAAA